MAALPVAGHVEGDDNPHPKYLQGFFTAMLLIYPESLLIKLLFAQLFKNSVFEASLVYRILG